MDIPKSSEPQTLIAACTAMLSRRRFSSCRDFALRVPRSDPYLSSSADQILAICDVLSAADRRDWYSVLQLRPADAADLELARQHFKKLALLLDPNTNAFPLSAEALTCLLEAWNVISDPQRRHLYERELAEDPNPPPPPPPPPEPPRSGTFWTACPYCWNMYEYEVVCENCALRCEGCRKVFHGVAVTPPVREETVVVEGERRQYYSCQASVPLKYCEVSEMKKGEEDHNMGGGDFIVISDDDDVFGGEGVKGGGNVRNVALGSKNNGRVDLKGSGNNNNSGKRRMRVKTVAKKAVGNRMMRRQQGAFPAADGDFDLDLDAGNGGGNGGELEFTQGADGDIFVGVRD